MRCQIFFQRLVRLQSLFIPILLASLFSHIHQSLCPPLFFSILLLVLPHSPGPSYVCEGAQALYSRTGGGLVGQGHRTHAKARWFLGECSGNSLVFFLARFYTLPMPRPYSKGTGYGKFRTIALGYFKLLSLFIFKAWKRNSRWWYTHFIIWHKH